MTSRHWDWLQEAEERQGEALEIALLNRSTKGRSDPDASPGEGGRGCRAGPCSNLAPQHFQCSFSLQEQAPLGNAVQRAFPPSVTSLPTSAVQVLLCARWTRQSTCSCAAALWGSSGGWSALVWRTLWCCKPLRWAPDCGFGVGCLRFSLAVCF